MKYDVLAYAVSAKSLGIFSLEESKASYCCTAYSPSMGSSSGSDQRIDTDETTSRRARPTSSRL